MHTRRVVPAGERCTHQPHIVYYLACFMELVHTVMFDVYVCLLGEPVAQLVTIQHGLQAWLADTSRANNEDRAINEAEQKQLC